MFARIRSFLSIAFRPSRFEQEMDSELRTHMEAYVADLTARGVPRDTAELQARREFGAVQSVKNACRDARRLHWLDELRRDFRYAFRLLKKSPTFTFTAVMTLALCIGANTAVFSVVDAVLLRPLPYPQPDRLASVAVHGRGNGLEYEQTNLNGRMCELIRNNAKSIRTAVAGGVSGVNFVSGNRAQYVRQQRVSAGFFSVLGIGPLIGREFTASEDHVGGPALAILSNSLWRKALHADRSVIGQKITLRGEAYTVAGVMPPGFETSKPVDLWTPLHPSTTGEGGGSNYELIARLRTSVSWAQANTELESIGQSVISEWHLKPGQSARLDLMPLQRSLTQDIRHPILILWAAVGLVLLIGCVNIASLLLARSAMRAREIATRMALGSGKAAVVRQLLVESLLLAAGGGIAGTALGYFALQGLKFLASDTLGLSHTNVALDGTVLAVTALTALLTSLVFGFYPALQTTRVDIRSVLSQGSSRGASSSHRGWARGSLVITEVGLSVVLLICAGLLIRTLTHLTGLKPGFDGTNVMTASLSLQDARYATSDKTNQLFDESLQRIRRIPGVESAGIGLTLPYQTALNDGFARLDGPHVTGNDDITNLTYVTPGYFETLKIPPLQGRVFADSDGSRTQPVVIVNEAFTRKYLREQQAVGSHLRTGDENRRVVGVVGDVQQSAGWGDYGPSGAVPTLYIPAAQTTDKALQLIHTWFSPSWVVRTSAPLPGITASLQSTVAAIDPLLPFAEFQTMGQIRSHAFAFQRLNAVLLGTLAGLALLLAAIGIYGLVANSVAERTRELGIRMALGASVAQAIRAVCAYGLSLTLAGLLVGCVLAVAAARVLRTLLWGVTATDTLTFAGACGALFLVAALASFLPGLRVARIDPAQSLRDE